MTASRSGDRETGSQLNSEAIKGIALKLLAYCRSNNWAGYDPYDALNSRVFRALPFLDFKLARLVITQLVKRCPINLRPALLVPKTPNPKGVALFLSAMVKLSRSGVLREGPEIQSLAEMLLTLRSPGERDSCWGYNFDWQTRGELVPKYSPNIICTTFAANALLDAYELVGNPQFLEIAASAGQFILSTLFWRENDSLACFSYTPLEKSQIHNANLLGAAYLCRVGRALGESRFVDPALDATRFSVSKQHEDGSWDYGEALHQRWIDNFHTGFNLLALKSIRKYADSAEFDMAMRNGLEFYLAHFFREDGAPKYYNNATYPLDVHSAAQSIITLIEYDQFDTRTLNLARHVLQWSIGNLWDQGGFFYYQQYAHHTVRVPLMRWSQAWMLLALATLLDRPEGGGETAS